MANTTGVSLPGKGASRTDLSRVQKIQRQAKIQNAPGGQYGQRNDLQTLAQGGVTAQTASAVSAQPKAMPVNVPSAPQGQPAAPAAPQTSVFDAPLDQRPLTSGSPYGAGEGPEGLSTPVDQMDSGEVLARAMYLANPTPQLRLLVQAYNEARG